MTDEQRSADLCRLCTGTGIIGRGETARACPNGCSSEITLLDGGKAPAAAVELAINWIARDLRAYWELLS